MAEDPHQFESRMENKRKYEDQTPPPSAAPPPRRPTGFSAPIASPSPDTAAAAAVAPPGPPGPPPSSYNNVPPPVDEIQLAKQRAQEIAARLFSNAEAKRPRLENGAPIDDSNDKDYVQKALGQQIANAIGVGHATSLPVPYGFQGASKKIDIPNGRVGVIIGKGGETIKYLQLQSGAKIQVTRDMDADPTSQTRLVELIGTSEQITKAEQLIKDVLAEAESGGSGTATARRFSAGQIGADQFTMKVPNNKVGLIIGKGGETIKNMQTRSGARIQLIPLHLPVGDTSTERTVQIDGTKEQIESAKQLVNEVISENRIRNPSMGGGYSQPGYRPPRPPTNWGPPGPPTQQPGYGYMQPGAYPGPPPQYMSQPAYAGYPSQPASAGYSSGWDPTSAPQSQQTTQGGGYDYYGQQAQQQPQQAVSGGVSSAPADNTTGYNYGQPPAASNYNPQGSYGEPNYSQPPQQGYSQDGYGGSGYSAPAAPQPGYSTAPTYGTVPNPTPDGSTAQSYGSTAGPAQVPPAQQVPSPVQPPAATTQQGYAGPQPATTPTNYASQGTTAQPSYGMPPTSQPGYATQPAAQTGGYGQLTPLTQSTYGQPQGQKPHPQGIYAATQQSPTTPQGGYVQPAPVQSGYSHTQPPAQSGYAQQDSSHRAPPTGFGPATQPGYGQQAYGGPPVAQPGYGQQPAYTESYSGGGYSQPSVYSTDSNVGGNMHSGGGYDAPPGAQAIVQSGVAKASPQS
eukprot:TRINITY_DN306_c0_g1_i2.p1 TRINITY_DN306_c0_g1~~TRINITY_DN306_c0_g1_i2.p1  ORF type:complete len:737 (-),score=159.05 TRINITY_DN306_c0_g1_i2:327-2537(-)